MDQCRNEILASIKEVNTGDGVVLLTDMFGGTLRAILLISVMPKTQSVVLAGVNLPTLIKLATVRDSMNFGCGEEAASAGQIYSTCDGESVSPAA